MRIKTTIRIDEQTLKSAQELDLNVSKACENALKIYINALTIANNQIGPRTTVNTDQEKSLGRDLNPRPPPYQGDAQPD